MNIDRATAAQSTMKHRKQKSEPPVRSSELVGLLACGCERTGTCVVRTYPDGRTEWGYACKCGKMFIKLGAW